MANYQLSAQYAKQNIVRDRNLGALLAWGIVALAIVVLAQPVATLARLYGSRYVLMGPTPDDVAILLAAGVVLGWLGAWIAAARHLADIEPRA